MSLWVLCNNHLFFSNLFVSSLLNWGRLPTASKWYGPITYHVQRRWSAPITYHVNSFYVENVNIWFGFELTYCGDNLGCPCKTQPPASIGWVALSSVFVVRSSRIGNISSDLHYMMFLSIQFIYFLWGYDPGNMSVSTYLLVLSWAQFTVVYWELFSF